MSNLQLNEPGLYKEFYGQNIDQMPKLLAEGRMPLPVAGLMQRRLETLNSSKEVKEAWWDNYFDTSDAILYHPDGNVKIVTDLSFAQLLNPKSKLKDGALVLPDGFYEKATGVELKRTQIEGQVGTGLSAKQAKENNFWQALIPDKNLRKEYINIVFAQLKERFSYTSPAMGIYLADFQKAPTGRLWCVYGLDGIADANGYTYLGNGCGRLVGVSAGGAGHEKNLEALTK